MSRLGRLFKLSQRGKMQPPEVNPEMLARPLEPIDPPGLFEQILSSKQHERESSAYQSPTMGMMPSTTGVLPGSQIVIGAGKSLFGDIGGSAAAVGTMLAGPTLKGMGIDLSKPWRVSYGSDRNVNEAVKVSGATMVHQLGEMGSSAKALLSQVSKMGVPISEEWIRSIPDAQAGQFLAGLAPFFPQVQSVMQTLNPNMMTDFSPIVRATYAMNNGDFNENMFHSTMQNFNTAYERGAFGKVPKDIAANAMAYAAERGARGPALAHHAANVARAADALVERGLAPNFGAAIQLADMIGDVGSLPSTAVGKGLPVSSRPVKFGSVKCADAMNDPDSVIRWANKMDNMARRGLVDKKQLFEASQVAMQQGIDVATAMHAVALAGRVKKVIGGGQSANYYANLAANMLSQTQKSGRVQDLAVLWSTNAKLRPRIEQALANNDIAELNRMRQIVDRNPDLRQMRNPQITAQFQARLMQNPGVFRSIVNEELNEAIGKNKELKGIFQDRGRLIELARTGDFSKLSPRAQRIMLGPNGAGMLASALAMAEDKHTPSFMPHDMDDTPKVYQLGLQTPEAKPLKPAAVGTSTPLGG